MAFLGLKWMPRVFTNVSLLWFRNLMSFQHCTTYAISVHSQYSVWVLWNLALSVCSFGFGQEVQGNSCADFWDTFLCGSFLCVLCLANSRHIRICFLCLAKLQLSAWVPFSCTAVLEISLRQRNRGMWDPPYIFIFFYEWQSCASY